MVGPPADPSASLSKRGDPAPRRRAQLSGACHRPRPTGGHGEGTGPSRPGHVAHGVRGRRTARTRGVDRMTIDDRELEEAMAALLTTAPPSLAPGVLAEIGLLDRYAHINSPIGTLIVAW